jgi:GTP cyclohydrolase I
MPEAAPLFRSGAGTKRRDLASNKRRFKEGAMMLDATIDNVVRQSVEAWAPFDRPTRPCKAEAEEAVRTLIRWAGDDPAREGLCQTPARVVRAYEEWFAGYSQDPHRMLQTAFGEVGGYDDLVMLRDIPLESTCEHHMAPIRGHVHIAYQPSLKVVGISKLARLVDVYGRRLQIQERLTAELADALDRSLKPRGVAVVIEAEHACMSSRGVRKHAAKLVTRAFRGLYTDAWARHEVINLLRPAHG